MAIQTKAKKRKAHAHESLPTRVYVFRAYEPVAALDLVLEQLKLAQLLRNELVEIERTRRRERITLLSGHAPEYAAAAQQLARLEAEEQAKRDAGKEAPGHRTYKEIYADRRAAEKQLRVSAAAAQKDDPAIKDALAAIDAQARSSIKQKRAETGTHWGTKGRVEEAMKQAFQQTDPLEEMPHWRRRPDAEAVTIQLQGGLSWEAAVACQDTQLRIEFLPESSGPWPGQVWRPEQNRPAADPQSKRSQKRAFQRRALVWFRVGSEGRRKAPLWAKIPVRFHRMPPPNTQIKWAHLRRIRVGHQITWEFHLVLSATPESSDAWSRPDRATEGTVGIDLGFHKTAAGIQVAMPSGDGDDPDESPLVLPAKLMSAWEKAFELQKTRAEEFWRFHAPFRAWLKGRDIPEWLREETRTIAYWNLGGIRKLIRIASLWRDRRFPGDAAMFANLLKYVKHEKHLNNYESFVRRQAIHERDDRYRKFARAIARRYRTVQLGDTDLVELKRNRKQRELEKEEGLTDAAREIHQRAKRQLQFAALGTLRQFCIEAAAEPLLVPNEHMTRRCHACGHLNTFEVPTERTQQCANPYCSDPVVDQDINAARNIRDSPDGLPPEAAIKRREAARRQRMNSGARTAAGAP